MSARGCAGPPRSLGIAGCARPAMATRGPPAGGFGPPFRIGGGPRRELLQVGVSRTWERPLPSARTGNAPAPVGLGPHNGTTAYPASEIASTSPAVGSATRRPITAAALGGSDMPDESNDPYLPMPPQGPTQLAGPDLITATCLASAASVKDTSCLRRSPCLAPRHGDGHQQPDRPSPGQEEPSAESQRDY